MRRSERAYAVAQSLNFILSVMGSWGAFFPTKVPFDFFPVPLKNSVNHQQTIEHST